MALPSFQTLILTKDLPLHGPLVQHPEEASKMAPWVEHINFIINHCYSLLPLMEWYSC